MVSELKDSGKFSSREDSELQYVLAQLPFCLFGDYTKASVLFPRVSDNTRVSADVLRVTRVSYSDLDRFSNCLSGQAAQRII